MFKKTCVKVSFAAVLLLSGVTMYAQSGAYSGFTPYSLYGIGEIAKEGTAYNKSMGGVGIASRNNRYLNYLNPAAVTARDTLSFMADFGLQQNNQIFKQNGLKSTNNTFNINNFAFSFPIYRSSAMFFGIAPYSNVGYDISSYENNPSIIGQTGNIGYNSSGNGSLYQVFGGGGVTLWNRLSIGAEAIYYFGKLEKSNKVSFSDGATRSISSGADLKLRGTTAKVGVQYESPIGSDVIMTIGATYKFSTNMRGYVDSCKYAYTSSIVDTLASSSDTLKHHPGKVKFANEIGVGVAFKIRDKLTLEFDYIYSDWANSGMSDVAGFKAEGSSVFSSTDSHSFRLGMEYVPNRNDIRYYYRRCAYRAGAYYNKDHFVLDGTHSQSYGITFGATLPVFKWYNGLTIAVDLGQRGGNSGNMVKETYANFSIGFNIFDIWFQKQRYN